MICNLYITTPNFGDNRINDFNVTCNKTYYNLNFNISSNIDSYRYSYKFVNCLSNLYIVTKGLVLPWI